MVSCERQDWNKRESIIYLCFAARGYFLAWLRSSLQKCQTVISSLSISKLSRQCRRKNKVVWVFLLVALIYPELWRYTDTQSVEKTILTTWWWKKICVLKPCFTLGANIKSDWPSNWGLHGTSANFRFFQGTSRTSCTSELKNWDLFLTLETAVEAKSISM